RPPGRTQDAEIGFSRVVGMDAALHAHLGRPARPCLRDASFDLFRRQLVRRTAVYVRAPALGERAERAMVGAYVGVVDVAIDDVAREVAASPPPQIVGSVAEEMELITARAKESDQLRLFERRARARLYDDVLQLSE